MTDFSLDLQLILSISTYIHRRYINKFNLLVLFCSFGFIVNDLHREELFNLLVVRINYLIGGLNHFSLCFEFECFSVFAVKNPFFRVLLRYLSIWDMEPILIWWLVSRWSWVHLLSKFCSLHLGHNAVCILNVFNRCFGDTCID